MKNSPRSGNQSHTYSGLKSNFPTNYIILESILDPIVIIDLEGIIINVNQALVNLTNYQRPELINTSVYQYLNNKRSLNIIECALKRGTLHEVVFIIHTKDKKEITVSLNASGFSDEQGQLKGLLISLKDLTQQKTIQTDLNSVIKDIKRSNKELEEFAYMASHDLKEPIRTIKSYLQLLLKRYSLKLGEEGKEFIEFALGGASRMESLINNLLTLSRISLQDNPFLSIDSNEMVKHVLHDLNHIIQEKKAKITYSVLPTLIADEIKLNQVFQNLISNALKYNHHKPIITIKAKVEKESWLFSIKDNGIGIEPEYLDKVFSLFQRLNNKNQFEGSGIGLAICRKIIEQHGGKIWAESKGEGRGATFYSTIPKRDNR